MTAIWTTKCLAIKIRKIFYKKQKFQQTLTVSLILPNFGTHKLTFLFKELKIYLYLSETSKERENAYKQVDRKKKTKKRDKDKITPISETPVNEVENAIEDSKFNFIYIVRLRTIILIYLSVCLFVCDIEIN